MGYQHKKVSVIESTVDGTSKVEGAQTRVGVSPTTVNPEWYDGNTWQTIASCSYVDSKILSPPPIVVSSDLELTPITDGYRVGLNRSVKLGGGRTRIPVVSQHSSANVRSGMLQFVIHQV